MVILTVVDVEHIYFTMWPADPTFRADAIISKIRSDVSVQYKYDKDSGTTANSAYSSGDHGCTYAHEITLQACVVLGAELRTTYTLQICFPNLFQIT